RSGRYIAGRRVGGIDLNEFFVDITGKLLSGCEALRGARCFERRNENQNANNVCSKKYRTKSWCRSHQQLYSFGVSADEIIDPTHSVVAQFRQNAPLRGSYSSLPR